MHNPFQANSLNIPIKRKILMKKELKQQKYT